MKAKNAVLALSFLLIINFVPICHAQEITFSRLLPPFPEVRSISNAEYLFEGIKNRQDVKTLFSDLNRARKFLYEKVKKNQHFHTDLPCSISDGPETIFDLSLPELIRVYLLLDDLDNGRLAKQVSRMNLDYKEVDHYEPGGLGLINGRVMVEPIPSVLFKKTPEMEAGYLIPQKDLATPHIFTFHVHPLGNKPVPGPSWSAKFTENKEAKIGDDIGIAIDRAQVQGDAHQVLFSKMYNRFFNVDYYVAKKTVPTPGIDPYQFCGKLKGFRIIDLGTWY